ncbi:MAG: metallophosphatase domain-containing protein [Deltaproteobacteria bacterium]|nr:metallophosphatase domain-containing protein [Deltaproteobacteria bacterium]
MRLVLLADTHTFQADLAGKIPDGDLLVHAGDLGRAGDAEELAEVAAWLRSQPHRHKLVVPGNHDALFEDDPTRAREIFDGLVVLIDEEATVGGLRVYGSPWTPRYHSWSFMKERGAPLAAVWAKIPAGLDLLITHGPPKGVLDDASSYRGGTWAGPELAGCEDLARRVELTRPRVHAFGHIHGRQGVVEKNGTRFVNCTTSECEHAPVVLDL